ncbi:hypothetical protein ACFLSJ_00500 [Verrucomicrobiota bacterium]
MKLSLTACYALAWRSFSKWWIPLCLISGIIIVFQIIPRVLVRSDMDDLSTTAREIVTAFSENDLQALEEMSAKMVAQTGTLMRKLITFGFCVFPFVALFTIALLMYANRAVKDRQEPNRPVSSVVYIALVHVVLAIGKLLAFLFFLFPGVYLYVRLLFVSLIMLEEKRGAGAAIKQSWQMTRGNFWILFLLVLVNTGIQLLLLPTVIGEIPATGFVNTARAAAFRMILEEGNYAKA